MSAAPRQQSTVPLVEVAQAMLIESYRGRMPARALGKGLELRLMRDRDQYGVGALLRLTIRRSSTRPSAIEVDIVRQAFAIPGKATSSDIAGGVVITWRDDECVHCGVRRDDERVYGWGMVGNAELCPKCWPPAAQARLAELRAARPVADQLSLL
jgi:hypothetical protein